MTNLKWRHLIPVFSYFALKGKCQYCGSKIGIQYPFVELLTALGLITILYQSTSYTLFLWYGSLYALMIIVSAIDIKHMIIPNSVIITGFIVALTLSAAFKIIDIKEMITGFMAGGSSLYLIAAIGSKLLHKQGLGGGDIKFTAMIGIFVGLRGVIMTLIVAFWSGACFGLISIACGMMKKDDRIPFAPFLSLGALIYILTMC
jgi:leader peptidase (prepilin peptidase)/N-methyltransferase